MKLTSFGCDNCQRTSTSSEEGLLNHKGWLYLNQVNIHGYREFNKEEKDKHFCSAECLTIYIGRLLDAKHIVYQPEEK